MCGPRTTRRRSRVGNACRQSEYKVAANTNGTIKRLTDKGFGFIAAGDGTEYFFHQSAVQGAQYDQLREGQRVTFTIGQGPKGPRAENVRPE
jgi:CspA family cold shock protein